MSKFKLSECAIPVVWCGRGDPPQRKSTDETYYYKTGDRYECVQKGFGAGMHTERKKNLSKNSLQQIKYVGDVYESRFKANGINTLSALREHLSKKTSTQIEKILKKIFIRKGGSIDSRAYNSTIIYLYHHGNTTVPRCLRIHTHA